MTIMSPAAIVHYPPSPQPLAEDCRLVLKHAANYLAEYGWCQNRNMDAQGRMCAMQSISWAANMVSEPKLRHVDFLISEVVRAVEEHISPDTTNMRFLPIVHWNDHPGRTKDEVMNVFMAVAES